MKNTLPIARLLVSFAGVLLGACAGTTGQRAPAPVSELAVASIVVAKPGPSVNGKTGGDVRSRILEHHATWRGTPHRWGGISREGVDCSGYVYQTYQHVFARDLPRTTRAQATLGESISRTELRDGDLVFFKTGRDQRHVGVYIGDGQFAHASRSRGVTISSLDNVYWKRHYWQSRRLVRDTRERDL